MDAVTVRLVTPGDIEDVQRLLCGVIGFPGGPLRGTQPSAAGVSAMLQRVLMPVVAVDPAGEVRSVISGYGLDLIGEDFVFLSVCSDEEVIGGPIAVLGVAAWLEAFRSQFPLTRVLLEGPSAVFRQAALSKALIGPLVRRPDSWWVSGHYVEYQMWELDVRGALELADRLRSTAGNGNRSPDLDLCDFEAEFRAEMGLASERGDGLALDSLATAEAIAVIADMAGSALADDALCERIDSIRAAFALYQRLSLARGL